MNLAMSTATIGYKVVQLVGQTDGWQLVSACQNPDFPEQYRVTYTPGQWVEAVVPGTKLFVFTDLRAARQFAGDTFEAGTYQIWSCECLDLEKAPAVPRPRLATFDRFWASEYRQGNLSSGFSFYRAYLASAIKLTSRA